MLRGIRVDGRYYPLTDKEIVLEAHKHQEYVFIVIPVSVNICERLASPPGGYGFEFILDDEAEVMNINFLVDESGEKGCCVLSTIGGDPIFWNLNIEFVASRHSIRTIIQESHYLY